MRIGGIPEGGLDLGGVHRTVRAVRQGADAGPHDDRVAGGLIDDEVVLATGDGLLAALEVGELRDEVAHRARRDEQAGLLAQQLRAAGLQRIDRRVVAEDVVADLGLGHRPTHLGRWLGDCVAAQIDRRHGRRV